MNTVTPSTSRTVMAALFGPRSSLAAAAAAEAAFGDRQSPCQNGSRSTRAGPWHLPSHDDLGDRRTTAMRTVCSTVRATLRLHHELRSSGRSTPPQGVNQEGHRRNSMTPELDGFAFAHVSSPSTRRSRRITLNTVISDQRSVHLAIPMRANDRLGKRMVEVASWRGGDFNTWSDQCR